MNFSCDNTCYTEDCMKTIMTCSIMVMLALFLACDHDDDDKKSNCRDAYVLSLAACRTLPAEEQSDCFFNAMGILFACDPESYWKMWGCDDGQPCM